MLSRMTQTALNQLRLMEQAFYVCRLDKYANAPDNRGWMNLFRNWGRSAQLNQIFVAHEQLFTREFVEFYLHTLRSTTTRSTSGRFRTHGIRCRCVSGRRSRSRCRGPAICPT